MTFFLSLNHTYATMSSLGEMTIMNDSVDHRSASAPRWTMSGTRMWSTFGTSAWDQWKDVIANSGDVAQGMGVAVLLEAGNRKTEEFI